MRGLAVTFTVVATLVIGGWLISSTHVAKEVTVTWAGEPTCTGATVETYQLDGLGSAKPYGTPRPVIHVTRKMHCVLRVEIANRSSTRIRVDRLEIRELGQKKAFPVVASPSKELRSGVGEDPDAHLEVNRDVAAGAHIVVPIAFRYRPTNCTLAGGGYGFSRFPRVDFTVLGRPHVTAPADVELAFKQSFAGQACSGN
ncbi:MAG: hypothetical protein JWP74_1456 [Marmoricola sp.]|nr:hypothetical protein [Marmoricola sp.]